MPARRTTPRMHHLAAVLGACTLALPEITGELSRGGSGQLDVTVAVVQLAPPTVWTAVHSIAPWASVAVVPLGHLADCSALTQAAQASASRQAAIPIVAGCGAAGAIVTASNGVITLATRSLDGDAAGINATINLTMGGGGADLVVGLLLGDKLWDPLWPRELMLYGAEVIVGLSTGVMVGDAGVHAAMLLTRGFENTAAVLDIQPTGTSHLANWCNDMLTQGCSNGSVILPTHPSAVANVSRVTFSVRDLRTQRASTIWGDAFRRPFTYQPLCFPSGILSRTATSLPRSLPPPPPPPPPPPAVLQDDNPFVVTVALLQMTACKNGTECLAVVEAQIRAAAAAGADVALTPEMWSMGYSSQWTSSNVPLGNPQMLHDAFRWTELSEPLDGPYVTRIASIAKEVGIAVAAGMQRRDDGPANNPFLWPPHNSVVLVDREGKLVYVYDKVHTCDWSAEEALTTPGRQWHTGVLATRGGNVTVGSMICADREFPESARTLALNGAELILTPNACGLVDSQLNQFRTRAVENVLGVAMTNYAQSQSCCNGRSVAYGHTGAALAGPATSEAQLLLAKFDVTAIRQARTSAAGQAMLRPLKTLAERSKLCELHRRPEFMRSNVYGRVAGSVV